MKSIEDEWLEFRKQVIPNDAPQVQLDEMYLAFIAGFALGHIRMRHVTGKLPDDLITDYLNKTQFEIQKATEKINAKAGVLNA